LPADVVAAPGFVGFWGLTSENAEVFEVLNTTFLEVFFRIYSAMGAVANGLDQIQKSGNVLRGIPALAGSADYNGSVGWVI